MCGFEYAIGAYIMPMRFARETIELSGSRTCRRHRRHQRRRRRRRRAAAIAAVAAAPERR